MRPGFKSPIPLPNDFVSEDLLNGNWRPDVGQARPHPESPTAPSGGPNGILGQAVLYSGDGFSGSAARAGGFGQGGTTGVMSTASTSSFVINISWDASV